MTLAETVPPVLDKKIPAALVAALRFSAVLFALHLAPAMAQDFEFPEVIPQEELEPEPAGIGRDYAMTALIEDEFYGQRFAKVFHNDDARAPPEFSMLARSLKQDMPDYAVGLVNLLVGKQAGRYAIVSAAFTAPLAKFGGVFGLRTDDPDSRERGAATRFGSRIAAALGDIADRMKDLKVESCQAEISAALAVRIERDWGDMLLRTRYTRTSDYEDMNWSYDPHYMSMPDETNMYRFRGMASADARRNIWAAGRIEEPMAGTKPRLLVESARAMRDYCRTRDQKYLGVLGAALDALEARLPQEN